MFEPDEDLKVIRKDLDEFITILKENKSGLEVKGMDVRGVIRDLEAKYGAVLRAAADADVETYKEYCRVMDPMAEEHPSHPEVKEWLEIKDAWKSDLPKEIS